MIILKYIQLILIAGASTPKNIGIKNSGSYLAFIDSDDIWYKEKLETQLDYVNKFSLICSLANRVDENGKKLSSEKVTLIK